MSDIESKKLTWAHYMGSYRHSVNCQQKPDNPNFVAHTCTELVNILAYSSISYRYLSIVNLASADCRVSSGSTLKVYYQNTKKHASLELKRVFFLISLWSQNLTLETLMDHSATTSISNILGLALKLGCLFFDFQSEGSRKKVGYKLILAN